MTSTPLPDSWAQWVTANGTADDNTKLDVLRSYIERTARKYIDTGVITANWVNKKLPGLGVPVRIGEVFEYTLEAPASGTFRHRTYATSRADAIRRFRQVTDGVTRQVIVNPTTDIPTIVDGPEDPTDPPALPDDAPDTVDAMLAKLRETILLAVVAGPRICEDGANEVLDDYGLDHVPGRKDFVVRRTVVGEAETIITAFDEATARRVAEWRWGNERNGFRVPPPTIASADNDTFTITPR